MEILMKILKAVLHYTTANGRQVCTLLWTQLVQSRSCAYDYSVLQTELKHQCVHVNCCEIAAFKIASCHPDVFKARAKKYLFHLIVLINQLYIFMTEVQII